MEGPRVAWAVACSLFHRKQAFEFTGQLLSMGCGCCPGAPSPFLQTTAERRGLRKASQALTCAWTVTIMGPSVTAPTWAPHYWTFCSFLSLWGRIRLTQKRCLLISGWSYIFVWNSKTFLNVVHLLKKKKKTKQHTMSISPEIQNSGILFLFVICQQHHTDFQSLEVK